jgi:hypothetical protein
MQANCLLLEKIVRDARAECWESHHKQEGKMLTIDR